MSSGLARLAGYAGAGVVGLFIGVITTLHHRSFAPGGLVLGLGLVIAWAAGLRLISRSRTVTFVGLLGVLAAQLVLASGIRDSFVVIAGPLGYALTLGVVLIALLALGWPDVQGPSRYDREEAKRKRGVST